MSDLVVILAIAGHKHNVHRMCQECQTCMDVLEKEEKMWKDSKIMAAEHVYPAAVIMCFNHMFLTVPNLTRLDSQLCSQDREAGIRRGR